MKTAIYIEDGVVQLVITPESKFEKNSLTGFMDKPLDAKMFSGSFYDCRGGWIRQNDYSPRNFIGGRENEDKSLILTIRDESPEEHKEKPQETKD